MMRMALTGLIISISAAVPASAQTEPFPDWESGPWQVYGDGSDCWLIYEPSTGTGLNVSVARTDDYFYVVAARPEWDFVRMSEPYPVRVRFGAIDYSVKGSGLGGWNGISTITEGGSKLLPRFLRARTITFTGPNKAEFRLDIDRTALDRFGACAASIGGPNSAPEDEED